MADRQTQGKSAVFANRALGHALKSAGIKRDDLANRAHSTLRGAENWIQGATGPQWYCVAFMLMDPKLRPLVMKAASATVEATKTEASTPV